MSKLPILIADDQRDVLEALRMMLKAEGLTCVTVTDPESAVAAVKRQHFACALLDLNYSRDTTSGREGIELIQQLRAIESSLPIVVMTAWGSRSIWRCRRCATVRRTSSRSPGTTIAC
jgi:CheY-like chemotaxis protein